mmetsp:Transcript_19077/g.34548  ORF Transcript_19077/g.34548 Transcript_19077/m.34548 type:complete len:213 (+) Transcript_19077:73-711(+)
MRDLFMKTGTQVDGKEICVLQVQPNLMGDIDKAPQAQPTSGAGLTVPGALRGPGVPVAIPSVPIGMPGAPAVGGAGGSGGKNCISELVIENGVVKENKTVCSDNRRLTEGAGTWILGGVFLDHFVVVFDFEQERLGFAYPANAAEAGQGGAIGKWDVAQVDSGSNTLRFGWQAQCLLAGAVAILLAAFAYVKYGRARGNVPQQPGDEETCLE